jgi:membrane protease YdiL (CAAX protease family)
VLPAALVGLALRVAPGFLIGILTLFAVPRQRPDLRLVVYILLFVLLRDALTPLGLWTLTPGGSIRLPSDPVLLIDLGLASFASVFVINAFEPELARLLVWFRGKPGWAVLAGILGMVVVVAPVLVLRRTLLPEVPLPPVPAINLGPLLVLALLGNFLEEALFRGYLQGLLEKSAGPLRAAFASGLFFALFHTFLTTTVTNVGAILLAFVWFEGTVAALVRSRYGVVASTITHGGAIFVLASGWAG